MSFININNGEFKVVLTEYGKQQLLNGKFNIRYFSIGDDGINYLLTSPPNLLTDISGTNKGTKINNIRYNIINRNGI